jgi:hypothetical protein
MRKQKDQPLLFDLRQAPPQLDAPPAKPSHKFALDDHMRQVKARLFAHQAIKTDRSAEDGGSK